jgi:hypothetical protein
MFNFVQFLTYFNFVSNLLPADLLNQSVTIVARYMDSVMRAEDES